jgi:protein MpaA
MSPRWLKIATSACLAATAGCEPTRQAELIVPPPLSCLRPEPPVALAPPPLPPPVLPEQAPAGLSVEGRAIRCSVHGNGGACVLILGGIHGDEPASVPICEQLRSFLERHPRLLAGRRVVVAPATNPDGLAANRRTNARGVDLNRNFDTTNRRAAQRYGLKPLSEPESRFIAELIDRYQPARIVTIHQPLGCVDFDGPARDLAAAMSRACGLPVRKLGARPGSLGSFAGVDRQIPIVTLELPSGATSLSDAEIWQRYGQALLVAIQFRGGVETAK